MAKKPTLTTVTSGFTSGTVINDNFTDLNDAFDNTLSRDGSTPNEMLADLDMNSNDILNAGAVDVGSLRINGTSVLPTEVVGYETDFKYDFKSIENLLNDTKDYTYFASGDYTRAGTGIYEVAASGASDHHVVSSGGVKHYVRTPVMNIREFGVFGNDTVGSLVDETAQFTKALDAAIASGSKLIIPGTNYQISSYSKNTAGTTVWIEGDHQNPPVIYNTQAAADAGGNIISFGSSPTVPWGTIELTADAQPGDQRITITSTAGLTVGSLIQLASDDVWYYDDRGIWFKGEIFRITRIISGTVVELDHPVRVAYDVSTETVTVQISTPNRVILENLQFQAPTPALDTVSTVGLVVNHSWRSEISNVSFKNFTSQGLNLRRSLLTTVDNFHGEVIGRGGSIGYGIYAQGVYGCRFLNINGRSVRRLLDFSGMSDEDSCICVDNTVDGFITTGAGVEPEGSEFTPFGSDPSFGIGTHGSALNTSILNGFISGPTDGITVRGGNTTIRNVAFQGKMDVCIMATFGAGLDVQGCKVTNEAFPGKSAGLTIDRTNQPLNFLKLSQDSGGGAWTYGASIIVSNNNCQGLAESFIKFQTASVDASNLMVTNNYVQAFPENAGTFYFFKVRTGTVNIVDSTLIDNRLERLSGSGEVEMYDTAISLGDNSTYGSRSPVRIGSNQFVFTLADDSVGSIFIQEVAGVESKVLNVDADSNNYSGLFRLRQNSAVKTDMASVGANIEALASTPTGTSGTNGNLCFHLGRPEDQSLNIENRLGSKKTILVTLL